MSFTYSFGAGRTVFFFTNKHISYLAYLVSWEIEFWMRGLVSKQSFFKTEWERNLNFAKTIFHCLLNKVPLISRDKVKFWGSNTFFLFKIFLLSKGCLMVSKPMPNYNWNNIYNNIYRSAFRSRYWIISNCGFSYTV